MEPMPASPPPSVPDDPASRLAAVHALEVAGDVPGAIGRARAYAAAFPDDRDWLREIERLEREGALARPYLEGLEALREGDYPDAARLLGWVAGKNARYRETMRHLYWAVEGRDPYARDPDLVNAAADGAPPTSLLASGGSAWSSPAVWVALLVAVAFGVVVGRVTVPVGAAPVEVAAPAAEPPAVDAPPEAPAPEAVEAVVDAAPPAPDAGDGPDAPPEAAATDAPEAPAEPAALPPADPSPPASAASATPSSTTRSTSTGVSTSAGAARIATLSSSCQNGDPGACVDLGDAAYYGRDRDRSLTDAARFYTRGCDLRSAQGCFNAGDMYEKGEGVTRDRTRAHTLFERGCMLNDAQSCARKGFMELEGI